MATGETVSNLNEFADTLSQPSVLLGTAGMIGLTQVPQFEKVQTRDFKHLRKISIHFRHYIFNNF